MTSQYPPNHPDDGFTPTAIGWSWDMFSPVDRMFFRSGHWPNGATFYASVLWHDQDEALSYLAETERRVRWKRYEKLKSGEEVRSDYDKRLLSIPWGWLQQIRSKR